MEEELYEKNERLNRNVQSNKIQNVRAFEEEKINYIDDWMNEDPVLERIHEEDFILRELEEESDKIQKTVKKNKQIYAYVSEPLNQDKIENQTQNSKPKIDWILLIGITTFIFLFWLIFIRR